MHAPTRMLLVQSLSADSRVQAPLPTSGANVAANPRHLILQTFDAALQHKGLTMLTPPTMCTV